MGRKKKSSRKGNGEQTETVNSYGEGKKIVDVIEETLANRVEEKLEKKVERVVTSQVEKRSNDAIIPVDIYSRLAYPLIRSPGREPYEESDEEETVVINFWPRFVFASSLCLVCMEVSRIVCESCGMVSYCSIKHKKEGLSKHRDLCKILTKICRTEGALAAAKEFSAENYRIYRLELIRIIECGMNRPLKLWEREIVLYPPVCRTCRDSSTDLKCCPTCSMDYYCEDHLDDHKKWCQDFQIFRKILFMQHKHGRVDPYVPNVTLDKVIATLPEDLDLLMARLYGSSSYYCRMDCHTYSTLSQLSTIPLTTLYAVQTSCPSWRTIEAYTIHVIGAEFHFECIDLHVWEKLFLHLMPELKTLSLVFVGPELQLPAIPVRLLAKVKTCFDCKRSGRSINVSFQPGKCYHEYASSIEFSKPDILCLFNPGLYRRTGFDGKDTWPASIRRMCDLRVPILVTSYTAHEIPWEMARIKSISNVDEILKPRKNPFASYKPERNFVSDDAVPLIYKNYYLAVVKGK